MRPRWRSHLCYFVFACLTALRSSGSISRSTYDPTKCTVVGIFEATLSPCPVSMLPVLVGSSSSSVTTLRWGAGYGIMGCSLNYSIHGTEDSIVRDAAVASAVLVSFTSAALCRSCVQSWWWCWTILYSVADSGGVLSCGLKFCRQEKGGLLIWETVSILPQCYFRSNPKRSTALVCKHCGRGE